MPEIFGAGKEKVILVTGGSGMVGKAVHWAVTQGGLGNAERETWIFLSSKDGDLANEGNVKTIYEKYRPTDVIHVAAMVGGLFRNMAQPADMFHQNILMNTHIIHYAHVFGVKKCISMLSTCIFPDGIKLPMDEKDVHLGPPHDSNFAYAYAKRMIDIQNEAYHKQFGAVFTSLVPTNIYGQYDNFNLEDSHVIPGIMHKMVLAEKKNEPLIVFGTGKPLRQFVYGRDIARCLVWMLHNYNDCSPLICVGDEGEMPIRDVVTMLAKAMKFNGEIQYDVTKSDGQFAKTASNVKLKSLAPDFKFTPHAVALQETCDWFRANFDNCRK